MRSKLKYLILIPLIGVCTLSILPFFWLVRSSFMTTVEIFSYPPKLLPEKIMFSNYTDVFEAIDVWLYLRNTVTIIIPCMIGNVLTSAMCGYAFAKLEFKYKRAWFTMVIATMMLPGAVTMIPTFLMWSNLGFVDSFVPLIAPAFFGGGAFNVFLMRQFFAGLPKELKEAAYIDGANQWQIFSRIMLPLVKPAMMVVGFFTFTGVWNDFFNPLIYLNDPSKFTLALGLLQFKGQYTSQWNLMMAAANLMTIPAIIVFFVGQKYFIQGISLTSGTKG